MIPKIVSLLTILIPSIGTSNKLVLFTIWLLKLIIDYDAARPGHSGKIYGFTKHMEFEVGELFVACTQFIPAVIFLVATILLKTWIPLVPGIISAIIYFAAIVGCIKDMIVECKRRRERNANSDNQK